MIWRYIRGSMSVAGVFPPICDPSDGHHLIDGCYVNNVPGIVSLNGHKNCHKLNFSFTGFETSSYSSQLMS